MADAFLFLRKYIGVYLPSFVGPGTRLFSFPSATEQSVNGEGILALAEAKQPYDVEAIHRMRLETMTFNAFELGTIDAVKNAFDILSDGGVVIEEMHEYPWSACGATVIDKYGVCWWISV